MGYVVRARLGERGGRYTAEFETREAAIKSAKELRQMGCQVMITGPDGKPVDETQDE